ncbi:MAG: DUF349 domain-containing protein [Bacteroidota bacterium]
MESKVSNEYGYIREGKIYLRGYLDFPDRQIGEVKISEEATVNYFTNRFKIAEQKVEELRTLIEEALNKGSYLMKLIHLRQYLAEFDGLGDYVVLFERLDVMEEDLRKIIVVNRAKNLEIKQALVQEAETLVDSIEWQETTDKFKDLKTKWIKTGLAEKEWEDKLEAQFNELVDGFFRKRKEFFDEQNRLVRQRNAQYESLIERVFGLRNESDVDAGMATLKKLQEEWKAVGKIPAKKAALLWKKFKKGNDFFYERYKRAKGIPSQPFVKKVDPKILAQEKMCSEAEALAARTDDMIQAAERGKQLLMEWKDLGRPKVPDNRLADRFRLACDKIFELNYLMRVVKRKHHFFEQKRMEDQIRIKVDIMSDLIRKDKSELSMYESSVVGAGSMDKNQTIDKMVLSKLSIQKRKIGVKEKILQEFMDKLKSFS